MFDAILPSEPSVRAPAARVNVHGRAELDWKTASGGTCLGRQYNTDPLKFLFPRTEQGQPKTAVLVTTSGGLVGGDELDLHISTAPGAAGLAMTQAAEKVYRSTGPVTRINATFDADIGSRLEWLPHETILFDGARLCRTTRLNLAADANAIVGELLVLGRAASGETVKSGMLRECWEVRRQGRLIWADALHIDDDWAAASSAAAGLDGNRALATLVCAADDPASALNAARNTLKSHEAAGLRGGASIVSGLVLVRILAADGRAMRRAVADTWGGLRTATGEYGAALPRLWHM